MVRTAFSVVRTPIGATWRPVQHGWNGRTTWPDPCYGRPGVGKVVNLNKARKKKAKAEAAQRADVNRRLHGRTQAERLRDELAKKRLTSKVDGAFLERPKDPPDGEG